MSASYIQDEAAGAHPLHSTKGTDHKAWAKRILYREQRKDPSITALQVNFAREALDIPKPDSK